MTTSQIDALDDMRRQERANAPAPDMLKTRILETLEMVGDLAPDALSDAGKRETLSTLIAQGVRELLTTPRATARFDEPDLGAR